jgi:hypothetical protein
MKITHTYVLLHIYFMYIKSYICNIFKEEINYNVYVNIYACILQRKYWHSVVNVEKEENSLSHDLIWKPYWPLQTDYFYCYPCYTTSLWTYLFVFLHVRYKSCLTSYPLYKNISNHRFTQHKRWSQTEFLLKFALYIKKKRFWEVTHRKTVNEWEMFVWFHKA